MTTKFDWEHSMRGLPDVSKEALKNYFLHAYQPGSFLTSLLCNDPWSEVIGRADHWNKPILGKYLEWLYENAPAGSWGSEQEVASWLNKGPAYQQFQKAMVWETLSTDHTGMKD